MVSTGHSDLYGVSLICCFDLFLSGQCHSILCDQKYFIIVSSLRISKAMVRFTILFIEILNQQHSLVIYVIHNM